MKKVKKMAVGGMNASAPPTQSQLQASVPRTQSQMQAAQRGGFSSTPTMGGLASLKGGNMRNMQKVDNRPAPPGTPGLQRFSTPDQYKQAEAGYQEMQRQQQLANSVGRLPASPISPASIQKIDTSTGGPPLQRFSTPDQYKQAEASYRQMQKQQQLANSLGPRMETIKSFGPANPPIAADIRGAAARALGLGIKKGGAVKGYAKGGAVKSSASKRADGCAQRGKTKGRMV